MLYPAFVFLSVCLSLSSCHFTCIILIRYSLKFDQMYLRTRTNWLHFVCYRCLRQDPGSFDRFFSVAIYTHFSTLCVSTKRNRMLVAFLPEMYLYLRALRASVTVTFLLNLLRLMANLSYYAAMSACLHWSVRPTSLRQHITLATWWL